MGGINQFLTLHSPNDGPSPSLARIAHTPSSARVTPPCPPPRISPPAAHIVCWSSWRDVKVRALYERNPRYPKSDNDLLSLMDRPAPPLGNLLLVGQHGRRMEGRATSSSGGCFGLQGSHHGCGPLVLSAESPDWRSYVLAVRFDIPQPSAPSGAHTAQVAELLVIYAGLPLLHPLQLRGRVYLDCLSAMKKITRRWSPGNSFLDAGAAFFSSSRTYLSDLISIQSIRSFPTPPLRPVPANSGVSP